MSQLPQPAGPEPAPTQAAGPVDDELPAPDGVVAPPPKGEPTAIPPAVVAVPPAVVAEAPSVVAKPPGIVPEPPTVVAAPPNPTATPHRADEPPTAEPPTAEPPTSEPEPRNGEAQPVTASAGPAAPPDPSPRRLLIGIALGFGAAALGGWILGEYPFTGLMPYLTGVLFALVVAEVMLSISHQPGRVVAIAACLASVGGIGLAVWIQSTEGLIPIPIGGWVAIVIGAVVALFRGGIRTGARPKVSSQTPA